VGGKKQLLDKLQEHFPPDIVNFYEPFGGSLSVTLYVIDKYPSLKNIYVADMNPKLVNLYKHVRNNTKKFIEATELQLKLNEDYYTLREKFNTTQNKLEEAVLMWILNKKCFNGLYRVNKSGKFNVPEGKSNVNWEQQIQNIKIFAEKIKKVSIETCDFRRFFETYPEPQRGDLVYVDPPYWDTFTAYTGLEFSEREQRELHKICSNLKCNVVCSNSNTDFIKELYNNFDIHEIEARRSVNSDASKRSPQLVEVIMKKCPKTC
jgi:DNA adenine methylase